MIKDFRALLNTKQEATHHVAIYSGMREFIKHESCNKTYISNEQLHTMELCIYHGIKIRVEGFDGEPISQICRCTESQSWRGGDRLDDCVWVKQHPWRLLWGFSIPITNTILIRLSTTAYLFLFLSSSYPKTEPLVSLVQERPRLNLLQLPSPIYRKTRSPRRATTPQPTPRMVMRRYSSTSTPGNQYSRVPRNEKPLGKCGFNVLLPTDKEDFRITRLPVAERIRILSSVDQTYIA